MRVSLEALKPGGAASLYKREMIYVAGALGLGLVAGALSAFFSPIFAIAAVIGLVILGLMIASPQMNLLVLVGVITLLPFGVVPVRFGLTLSLLEFTLIVLFAIWGLRMIAGAGELLEGSPLNALVIVFMGLAVFSFILGISQSSDSTTIHNFFKMMLAIVLFFVVLSSVRRREQVELIVKALIIGGAASAVIGLSLYVIDHSLAIRLLSALSVIGYPSGADVLRFTEDNPALPLRATSTSVDPNSFGGLLVAVFAVTATQFLSKARLLPRYITLPAVGLVAGCILLTNSRAAWLGVAVALVVLATLKYRWLWLVLAAGAVGVLAMGIGGHFLDRFIAGIQLQDQATQMRLAEYQNALEIIRQYPFFGVGFGRAPQIDLTTGVSSVYLAIGERMGLVGLLAFLVILATYFVKTIGTLFHLADERWQGMQLGFIAAVAGAMTVGVLDHYYFNIEFPHMVALFWLILALSMVVIRVGAKKEDSEGVTS